jgi:formate transporter
MRTPTGPLAGIEGRLPPEIAAKAEQDRVAKAGQDAVTLLVLGALCNTLACLAVWLSLSSRLPAHRLLVVVLPIAAFLAAGFEHAVANMRFLAIGPPIRDFAGEAFWTAVRPEAAGLAHLGYARAASSLVAVTLGNILGGAVFVAGTCWLLYRRGRARR